MRDHMRLQQIAINELNKEIDNFHKKDSAVFHMMNLIIKNM